MTAGLSALLFLGLAAGAAIVCAVRAQHRTGQTPPDFSPTRIRLPPTDRQLNLIDALIVEREAEDWMLEESDPETGEAASAMIEELLELPYRQPPDG